MSKRKKSKKKEIEAWVNVVKWYGILLISITMFTGIPLKFLVLLSLAVFLTLLIYFGVKKYQLSRFIRIDLDEEDIISADKVPDYTGIKNIYINNNKSLFDSEEVDSITRKLYGQSYGFGKMKNGRPQYAVAVLTPKTYNSSERGSLNTDPVGFRNYKMSNGTWLFNRSHLLAFSFVKGNTDVPENIITGTREFNANRSWGMLKYEDKIREYLKTNGKKYRPDNKIIYQAIPIYRGNELVPIGLQMRAKSLSGTKLDMNVFIYNVQDGVKIKYRDGEARAV